MPKTYNEIYIDARKKLKEQGVAAYALEARIIVGCAAGKGREELLKDMGLYTSKDVEEKTHAMIERRLKGEPVAYITGSWEFYGLPIMVSRDVLIPRVDTEVLVETAIGTLRGRKMDARELDLCTGSGCIGCAIAKELPATHVVLGDISTPALGIAKSNVLMNRLNPRVTCVELDALLPPPMMLGSFEILVCNPPYIPSGDIDGLDAEVKKYEPMSALDGGKDGLLFYRAILNKWRGVVRNGGMILFEVGIGQAEDVATLMRAAEMKNVGTVKDTLGIDRVVYGNV